MDNRQEYDVDGIDSYDEEFAAEFADTKYYSDRSINTTESSNGSVFSYIGILFAIMSMFIMPTLFAIIGIVFGLIGIAKKSTGLGVTAVVLGIASLFMTFIWMPFTWMR